MAGSREISANRRAAAAPAATVRTLALAGLEVSTVQRLHHDILLARALDEAEIKLKRQQRTFFEISCTGHEIVQAAASAVLRPGHDWFYPYYRDRVLCLGLGVSPVQMLLQAMGKPDDESSGGREMPAHYGSPELHIINQSSPIGTQYLQAVGTAEAGVIARAAALRASDAQRGNGTRTRPPALPAFEEGELVYVSGGEGSTSEGEFYEALCLASLGKLPVLFLIQDNAYAISVPVEFQTPGSSISGLVRGFPHFFVEEINGLDMVESFAALRSAVRYVRSGQGPALVHAHVVRLCPHSDSDDHGAYKTEAERAAEKARDPLRSFEALLVEEGYVSAQKLEEIREEIRGEVARAVQEAAAFPEPDPSSVGKHLFSSVEVAARESKPDASGTPVTMVDSINRTLELEMERDPRVVCFGEDVADLSRSKYLEVLPGKGGVFKATKNLQRKFGSHRVYNTPIAEAGIVGRAVGLAVRGLRPVVEVQFFDYIWPAMEQIRNELAMIRWRSNNSFSAPVVVRVASGGYLTGGGPYHSQSGEAIFCHCAGLRVVMPSNARDAAGLLRAAIRCEDPVIFLEHKHLYRKVRAKAPYPGPEHIVPLGMASVPRSGRDVTVVTYGALVEMSLEAAKELEEEGVDAEVIDLRSLQPYDWDAIQRSVRKTSRVVVAYEDSRTHGYGAEIAARVAEELFHELDAPVGRVATLDVPVAYSPVLERATLPQRQDIVDAVRRICSF